MDTRPYILIVEDASGGVSEEIRVRLVKDAQVDLLFPSEVSLEQIEAADVVLLDECLDEWDERDALLSIALRPMRGSALAGVFRSHLQPEVVKVFCLITAHPENLIGVSPLERRGHVLAHANGLEWVFDKTQPETIADQVISLADAVREIQQFPIPPQNPVEEFLDKALSLAEDAAWYGMAHKDIERCQPPVLEL